MTDNNRQLDMQALDAVNGGSNVEGGIPGPTIYVPNAYPAYPWGTPAVWPPVDPNTASGLPPLLPRGGRPPGY